jgi:hypothetical protein
MESNDEERKRAQALLYSPNWHIWRRISVAAVWEWVALSSNLEPKCLVQQTSGMPDIFTAKSGDPYYNTAYNRFEVLQFHECLEIARRHARKGGRLRVEEQGQKDLLASVRLDAFVEFANAQDWALPDGFHAAFSQVQTSTLSESERNNLLKSIGLLALLVAERSGKYKRGDTPNASRIAEAVQEIVNGMPDANKYGTGTSSIRENIGRGLNLLKK